MSADGTDGATLYFLISIRPLIKGQSYFTALAALVSAFLARNCRRPGCSWPSSSFLSTVTLRMTVRATPEAVTNELGTGPRVLPFFALLASFGLGRGVGIRMPIA